MAQIAITDMRARRPTQTYGSDIQNNFAFSLASSWALVNGIHTRSVTGFNRITFPDQEVGKKYRLTGRVTRISGVAAVTVFRRNLADNANDTFEILGGGASDELFDLTVDYLNDQAGADLGVFIDAGDWTGTLEFYSVREVTETFALGPELVQGGDFDTDGSEWGEAGSGTSAFSAGQVKLTTDSAANMQINQNIGLENGQEYLVRLDVESVTANYRLRIEGSDVFAFSQILGVREATYTPGNGTLIELSQGGGAGRVGVFNSVSIKKRLSETPIAETILGASDTLEFARDKRMTLILRNTSGGALTPTLDGSDDAPVFVPGLGFVNIANGYTLPSVADGDVVAINLDSIKEFCKGALTITGADAMTATCIRY